jgi:hypothetical protein
MRRLSSSIASCAICVVAIISFSLNFSYGQSSPHGAIKIPCINCHTTESWKVLAKPMKFDHTTTGFTLQGAHSNTRCIQCHTTKRFTATPTDCFKCHTTDFTKALLPNHQLGKFSHDCLSCHTMTGWKPSVFQHSKTNFQLIGAHLTVDCASCHTNNHFSGLAQDCYSCHQKDFVQTTSPNHKTGQLSHDCLTCHTMNGWKPATFDHNKTNFRLVGAHAGVECSSCHIGGKFKSIASDCYSCHQKDYEKSTTIPNHLLAQFSHDCLTCHSNLAWKPATFNHNTTAFPLVGAHQSVECSSCHTNGMFKGLSTDCYECHQKVYANTISPNHSLMQLSQNCLNCHTSTSWIPSTFDHNKTDFRLTGAHLAVGCATCHGGKQVKSVSSECYSCHQQEFAKTLKPNHSLAQFSHDCLTCHSNITWKPSTFDHNKTNFQLVGDHATVACASCHINGVFKGLPSDCFSCHQNVFNSTTTPNHVTSLFSHDCLTCHTTTAWKPSTFNHANTNFPLLGAHAAVACGDCHKNGVYKGTSMVCYDCHVTVFNNTTTPSHVTSQFSHDCLTCHSMTAWKPATFNHSTTAFPLIGTHVSTPCASCHKNGVYKGTTTDCYTCHLADYNGAKNPDHVAGQYNTAHVCTFCHGTIVTWQPWTFNHIPSYPYSTNRHSAVKCNQCHFTVGSFTTYSCTTGCHSDAHNKTKSCVSSGCHPNRNTGNS